MVEIRTLNKNQLSEFIDSDEYNCLEFLPISYHRAISHINNPRLKECDTLLLLAFENNILLGYLGVLPVDLIIKGIPEHGGFLSCLWIHPDSRGKKIAQKLLEVCFEKWNSKILVTEFTESAKSLYDKTGVFKDLKIKEGIRIYFESDLARILPEKRDSFVKYKFVLKIADTIINVYPTIKRIFKKIPQTILKVEKVETINQELYSFILSHQKNELFKRNQDDLNWIIRYPWVLNGLSSYKEANKYHFSSVASHFSLMNYVLRNKDGDIVAFLMFSFRDGIIKIPYCFFEKPIEVEVVKFIEYVLFENKCKTFTMYHPKLIDSLLNSNLGIFKKRVKRHYIISKVFPEISSTFEIQDGDADCAFT